jgi:hypothetical protein
MMLCTGAHGLFAIRVTSTPFPRAYDMCAPFPAPTTYGDLYTGTSQTVHLTPFPCAYVTCTPLPRKRRTLVHQQKVEKNA